MLEICVHRAGTLSRHLSARLVQDPLRSEARVCACRLLARLPEQGGLGRPGPCLVAPDGCVLLPQGAAFPSVPLSFLCRPWWIVRRGGGPAQGSEPAESERSRATSPALGPRSASRAGVSVAPGRHPDT